MEKLAINGGLTTRNKYLAYGKQSIDEDDINSVIKVLKSDFLTTGTAVDNFEKKIANYVGAKYAVAVSNGTAALHAACFSAGIEKGDEVILSPMTFAASANAILYCGGTPVFVDIDEKTYNIDPSKIQEKITSKTKAIIAVDFAGQSCDIDKIREIANKHNLITIEDGAHALGSEYKEQKVGSKSDMTCFSFHPVKPITTGEGGVITTNDEALYKKLLLFRSHGITRDKNLLEENHGNWYYEQHFLGYNYRLTDIQCALGISQLNKLDKFINKRREIVKKYNEEFRSLKEIITPYEAEFSNSGWHIYVIQIISDLLKVGRKEIFDALRAENIGVNVHYVPVYYHPYYQKLGYEKGVCPIAEKIYENIITLPLFPSMNEKDVNEVIKAIEKVINAYRK